MVNGCPEDISHLIFLFSMKGYVCSRFFMYSFLKNPSKCKKSECSLAVLMALCMCSVVVPLNENTKTNQDIT